MHISVFKNKGKLCLGSFNFIKGFAICVVIFGHIATLFDVSKLTWFYPVFILLNYIKTPIMPLFFIISGYGFVWSNGGTLLRKTVRSLLLPYAVVMVSFGILQPIFACLQGGNWELAINKGVSVLLAFLLGIPIPGKVLFGIKLSHCAIVWFLLALFWAHNILNLILKMKRIVVQIAAVVACAAVGYWLFQLNITYFCLPHGLIATSYVYLGYALKRYRIIQKGLPFKWMYPVWVIIAVLYANWGEFDLCYGKFAWFPVDYIGVMFLALLLLGIGIYLGQFDWKALDIIHRIGGYSYWVLCIHSVEQKCLPWDKFIQLTAEYPNAGFIFALLIKGIIITVFCKLIKRLKKKKYRKQKSNYEGSKLCAGTD